MNLVKPYFLAMDTSHLAQWIRDSVSHVDSERIRAKEFTIWLQETGTLPLLTLHHIEELCAHNDQDTVRRRLRFLHSLPFIAWVRDGGNGGNSGPGGITSIMRAEVIAGFANPAADLGSVRDEAARALMQIGTGEDLLGTSPDDWLILRPMFVQRAKQSRNLVSVAHTNVVDLSSIQIRKLMSGAIRGEESVNRQLQLIEGSFSFDIKKHGDKRIEDPEAVARDFIIRVKQMRSKLPDSAKELVLQSLALMGVEVGDLRPDATVGDAMALGEFLQKMKVSTQDEAISFSELKHAVPPDRVPSWLISSLLRKYSPLVSERKGSEIIDTHLACLSPYADLTLVDKRTWEAFRRARSKNPILAELVKRIERTASYTNIPKMVRKESV
jgi:hypothetical protein